MPKKSKVPKEDAHSRVDSGFQLGVPGKFSTLALDSQTLAELGEYRRMFKNARPVEFLRYTSIHFEGIPAFPFLRFNT